MEKLNFKIETRGGPILNEGIVIAKGNNILAASIDMESKRCEIDGETTDDNNCPVFMIGKNNDTLHLTKGKENEWTIISFPDLAGWDIFCSDISRYTMRVCFVKN